MSEQDYWDQPPAWDHQAEAVPWLARGSYAMFWEQRLGKTRAAAEALRLLDAERQVGRVVVACPVNAKHVWLHAAKVFMSGWDHYVCEGLKAPQDFELFPPQFVIVNPEILVPQIRAAQTFTGWQGPLLRFMSQVPTVLIMDEPHLSFVNPTTDRYKAMASMARIADRVWIADGTPYEKSGLDLHWLLKMLGPSYPFYWASRDQFGKRFCKSEFNPHRGRQVTRTGRGGSKYSAREGGYDYGLFSDPDSFWGHVRLVADRRLRRDCIDVPSTRRMDIWCGEHPQPDTPADWPSQRRELVSEKVSVTVDYVRGLLERGEGPVVVAGHHVEFTQGVARRLRAPVIKGGVSADTRARICNEFQGGQHDVLVLNIRAGGVAIELSRAHHIVIGEIDWVARDLKQVEDRLQGINQRASEVLAHYLLFRDSVDEYVWERVLMKGRGVDEWDEAARRMRDLNLEAAELES